MSKRSTHKPSQTRSIDKEYSDRKIAAKMSQDGSSQIIAQHKTSVLPDPEDLKAFAEVNPAFPNMIFDWAEKNIARVQTAPVPL
jgi:hypothetical protein